MFRNPSFDADLLAEIMLRLVSGEDLGELVPEDRLIDRRDRCARCARRVIEEYKSLASVGGLVELEGAGHRSYRRERRWRRRIGY